MTLLSKFQQVSQSVKVIMYYTSLHYTTLYYTTLFYISLYYTTLYHTSLYHISLYCAHIVMHPLCTALLISGLYSKRHLSIFSSCIEGVLCLVHCTAHCWQFNDQVLGKRPFNLLITYNNTLAFKTPTELYTVENLDCL